MKKAFALLLCAAMLLICLPATAFAATIITRVELALNPPVAGQTPPQNCTILGNGYTIHSIDWEEIGGRGFLEAGEKLQEGYTYEATLWIKAADGYEFSHADSKTPAITGYINGDAVPVSKAYEYNAWAMVCLTVKFHDIPAKGWIKNINLTVPAPAAGEKPSYTQLSGLGYETADVSFSGSSPKNMENGIAWSPVGGDRLKPGQDTFGENTSYTFHCLIFPAEGYKILEKAAVWVNGKQAEATLDYDTFLSVEYTFPATGKTPPSHTHTYTDWAWNSGQHYKNCTDCDEVFFVESHTGGKATCTEAGKCTICGYAYMEAKGHKWSPTYLYQDASGHAWVCADCKAHSAIEKHTPGAAATATTTQTCTACGYVIAPAQNHTHTLTHMPYVAPTCLATGTNEHYTCSGCSTLFADAEGKQPLEKSVIIPSLTHETADTWSMDEQFHWRCCTLCQTILEETQMVHQMENQQCTTCGYGIEAEATAPTEAPAVETPQEKNDWFPIVLVFLVSFAAAITVTVIILKKKKGGTL